MSKHYQSLFQKFINHEISPEELEQLLVWIDQNEDFDDVEFLEKVWNNVSETKDIDSNKALRIRNKLNDHIRREEATTHRKIRRLNPWIPKVAAGLIFLILSSLGLINYFNASITVKSDFGEIVEVVLPDQSVVMLNANSKITYPRRWNKQKTRSIALDGEAFFEVSKDVKEGKKFVVKTKDLSVEVLGTEFNVDARDNTTKVFLESGIVKLNALHKKDSLMMEPGEIASIDTTGSLSKMESVSFVSTPNWKEGSMVLKDITLSEVLKEFELIYGEKYTVENKELLNQSLTIRFPITDKNKSFKILQDLIGSPIEIEQK